LQIKTSIVLAVAALILMAMVGCGTTQIPQVGDKAPAFTLESTDGKKVSLSDFQGKIVLIVFTSVNCKECETQMPYLVGAYQQENGNLEVLDIYHMIFDARLVRDYVTEKQFTTFPALPDPNNTVANAYGATRYPPTNFIIDAAGIIKYKKIGRFQSQEEIEDILKSL
jgi:peroxiredoxin